MSESVDAHEAMCGSLKLVYSCLEQATKKKISSLHSEALLHPFQPNVDDQVAGSIPAGGTHIFFDAFRLGRHQHDK